MRIKKRREPERKNEVLKKQKLIRKRKNPTRKHKQDHQKKREYCRAEEPVLRETNT